MMMMLMMIIIIITTIAPVIIGATGIITRSLKQNLEQYQENIR